MEIIEGAIWGSSNTVSHLTIIKMTMYPKVHMKNMSSGKKTKKNLE